MAYNLSYGYTRYAYAIDGQAVVLLLAVPILTMRSMAQERRSRTDQLLLTSPVTLWGVVLGKYLAVAGLFLFLTVLTLQRRRWD